MQNPGSSESAPRGRRALICGVSGQDGAYLAKLLLSQGYVVFGTSRDAQISSFRNLKRLGIDGRVHVESMAPTDFRSVFQVLRKTQAVASSRSIEVVRRFVLNSILKPGPNTGAAQAIPITLTINGEVRHLTVEPWTSLLDLLRDELDLTGTKKGCDHGQCGACTVLIDDRRVNSCLTLAVMKDGASITTIEGLAEGDALHPMQDAFIEHDAFQCGYCTPGQICSAVGLMKEGRAHSAEEIRELMSGNLCRCGCYVNIVTAIEQVIGSDGARVKEAAE